MAAPCSKRRKLDHNEDKSEAAIHLPEGAIHEILVRLPIKSIRRFQSTCKSWYALIRSRSFINFHTRFHRPIDYLDQLFFYDQGEHNHHVYALDSSSFQSTPVFDIGKLLKTIKSVTPAEVRVTLTRFGIDLPLETIAQVFEPCISVLGPLSNGIYCVVARVYARRTNYVAYAYSNAAFCNPATGEFKLISPPHLSKVICPGPHVSKVSKVSKVILPVTRRSFAKHLLEVKHHYGFGSIIQKKGTSDIVVDYKMVMIIQDSEWFKAFVYIQRRGSWKLICDCDSGSFQFKFPKITQDLDFLPQANLNGSCHWMTDEHHSILRFDLATEEFGMIPGPPDHHPNLVKRLGVFVLNDRLATIIIRYRLALSDFHLGVFCYTCDIDVWMMKEYGVEESWTKIHSCQFEIGDRLRLQKFLGMSFSKDNSTIERMFFQVKRGELLSYDCVGGVVERHSIFGRILKEDPTLDRFSFRLKTSFDDDEDGGIPWKNHLAPLEAVHSLTCWKTIGLSAYVETLEPVTLDMDEDEDTSQHRSNRNDEHHSILRFDLASEEFGLIPGPPDDDYINHRPNLVNRLGVFVLNDRLATIIIRYRVAVLDFYRGVFCYACDIDVWMMKEYGVEESWTKIHSCQFEIGDGLLLQKFLGMSFSKDNSTIERMFFQVKRGELLSYDCVGGVVERHSIFGRILKEDSTVDRFSFRLRTSFDDDEDGSIPWNHLAPLEEVHSLTCWKTIGLSAYVETLEPVTLDIDEDEDTRQQRCNRNAI